jgi:hypothetical protein
MATLSEIHASAKLGHLSDVQRDAILRINDHKQAWDFYRSYSQQRGVQYFPSDVFPELNLYSVAQGDFGPVIPVPKNFEQDQWYNWRPPVIFTYGTIAKLKPDAPPAYVDPGRPLANQIINAGDTITPSGNVTQLAPIGPFTVSEPVMMPTTPAVTATEIIAKIQPPDAPAVQPTEPMPASQYPVYLSTTTQTPVSVSPGTTPSNVQASFLGDLGRTLLGAATGFITGGPVGAVAGGVAGSGILGGNDQVVYTGGTPGFYGGPTPGVTPPTPPTTIAGIDKGLAELLAGAIGGVPGVLAQGAIDYFSSPSVPTQTSVPTAGLKSYPSQLGGPEVVEALSKVIQKAPPGYVLVTKDWTGNGNQTTYAVRKNVARHYGWRKPKTPPVTVGQMSAIDNSAKAIRAVEKLEKKIELIQCKKKPTRRP